MNYATIKTHDTANGPGVRVSLFVSGCTHQCKGCFNPEAWDFNYGAPFTETEEDTIVRGLEPWFIRNQLTCFRMGVSDESPVRFQERPKARGVPQRTAPGIFVRANTKNGPLRTVLLCALQLRGNVRHA